VLKSYAIKGKIFQIGYELVCPTCRNQNLENEKKDLGSLKMKIVKFTITK
jgi:cytochrome c-type biogenesis protein CcmH/NrfF